MSVTLAISGSSGGTDLSTDNSLGSSVSPGNDSDTQDMYISHDAITNPITDVSLYAMRDVSPSYPGTDADADIAEILGWADADSSKGIQINMNATSPSWVPMKTGSGDQSNPIELIKESIVIGSTSSDGEIPVDGEAKIQLKVAVPSSVSSAKTRGFSFVVAYSATS